MSQAHVQCSHCGLQNFAISAYCGRCERPLTSTPEATLEATLEANLEANLEATLEATQPEIVPPSSSPPLAPPSARGTWAQADRSLRPPARQPTPMTVERSATPAAFHRAELNYIGHDEPTQVSGPMGRISTAPAAPPAPPAMPRLATTVSPGLAASSPPPRNPPPTPARSRAAEPLVDAQHRPLAYHEDEATQVTSPPFAVRQPTVAAPRPSPAAEPITEPEMKPAAPATRGLPVRVAPLWRLLLAQGLDAGLALSLGAAVAALEIGWHSGQWPPGLSFLDALATLLHAHPASARHGALALLVTAAVHALGGCISGRTVGRACTRLRLIQARRGGPLTVWRICLRMLAMPLSGALLLAGFLWVLVDNQRRTWHDLLAGSLVVALPRKQP